MSVVIRKAQRKRAKLRCALFGPSGSGKTMSALKLAFGLGEKIGFVDTEHGSGELYAEMGDYDVIQVEAPYTVAKYREAITAFEKESYDVIIIDSLTHAWAGEGGLLDKQGGLVSSGKYKSGFDAWREVTPDHNKLVEELLNSPAHIIGTMRTKVEYVIEKNENGKNVPRKIGLAPIQREGMEYEFTCVFDVAENHYARASKDRTNMFDGWSDRISEETGRKLRNWLDSGEEAAPRQATVAEPPEDRAKAGADALIERFNAATTELVWTALDTDKTIRKQRDWLREHRPQFSELVEDAIRIAYGRVAPLPIDEALGMPAAEDAQ